MASQTAGPPPGTPRTGLFARLRETYEVLAREAAKFGVVGAVAFVTDFGVFNLLSFAGPGGVGVLHHKPLTANGIAIAVSVVVAWIGNRYWTFRHRRRASAPRELLMFALMNGAGLLISAACLGFTYYVLGLRGPVASNISAKVVGVGLGTLFRWWAYRRFVFVEELREEGWQAPRPGEALRPPGTSHAAQVDDVGGGQARRGTA
ncbi:GtrA family protein [Paenibacillus sp. TRM 82003]|uniref:GtrA family protein n=1 Tax=Kineococcus sp. TRM81007 TaxID=2925831 RepID=UPI001F58B5A0|nr:GtrA family protein [Kineococcus sp. TRM81007]MCI2238333.1 GtrA family protein [Kineococcus sp. TRM81007]MCI3923995.1 GtrA family protein [Paenibacillus sp. TRM 82003]